MSFEIRATLKLDSGDKNYAIVPLVGESKFYDARLVSLGSIARELSVVPGEFRISDLEIVFANQDNLFSGIDADEVLFNRDIEIEIGDPAVGESDFVKVVISKIKSVAIDGDQFVLRAIDPGFESLNRIITPESVLNETDFPNLPKETDRTLVPLVIGTIDTSTTSKRGGVPAYRINDPVVDLDTWFSRSPAADNTWSDVEWAAGISLFVAVSSDGGSNKVMTSPDGVTWTLRASGDKEWKGLAWSESQTLLVAVAGSTGAVGQGIMSSSDGISWTLRNSPADNDWRDVIYAEGLGLWVAVAGSGTVNRVMTSSDGKTGWTTRTSAADNEWQSIAWSESLGLLVAVASTGTDRVMTSEDGVNWTTRETPSPQNQWFGVTWSEEQALFVAVGGFGTGNRVMTSSDGINWTFRNTPIDLSWSAVEWAPQIGLFAAVTFDSSSTQVITSPNGIDWTAQSTPIDRIWRGIAWAPSLGIFAAVGSNGTAGVLTSEVQTGLQWAVAQDDAGVVSVLNLYSDEAELDDALWSQETKTFGGRDYRIVTTAPDQKGKSLTVDLQGLPDEDNVLSNNPIRILRRLLIETGYTVADFDDTSMTNAETILANRGIIGAFFAVNENENLQDVLEDFSESFGLTVFFTKDGKIGVTTPNLSAPAGVQQTIDESRIVSRSLVLSSPEDVASTADYDFDFNPAFNDFERRAIFNDSAQETAIGKKVRVNESLRYLRTPSAAQAVVEDKMYFRREERIIIDLLCAEELYRQLSIGDNVRLTHYQGRGDDGFQAKLFRVIGLGLEFDGPAMMTSLRLVDIDE